jgi:ATP-dependent Lon protease
MSKYFSTLFVSLAFVLLTAFAVSAQADASTPNGRSAPKEDLPKSIKESLEKQRIEREKKDYQEMIERGEEALKLSEELEKSVAQNSKISSQDQSKLERLEKIVKKIRKELGGDDDNSESTAGFKTETSSNEIEKDDKPLNVASAIKILQSSAAKLVEELKKTTRFSISAMAIQSSNALLRIVRFVQFYK